MSKARKILIAVLMAVVALFSFFGGYLMRVATGPNAEINWALSMLREYAYIYDEDTGSARAFTDEEILSAVVAGTCDRYSAYYTKDEYSDLLSTNRGNFYGVGMSCRETETDGEAELLIVRVTMHSPLDEAALAAGFDPTGRVLCGVSDGNKRAPVTDMASFNEGTKNYGAGVPFTLHFKGTEKTLTVARKAFVASYVRYADNGGTLDIYYDTVQKKVASSYTAGAYFSSGLSSLPAGVGYLRLDEFNGNADAEFRLAMEFFSEKFGQNGTLILDLQNNGGGRMDILIGIAENFIERSAGATVAVAFDKNGTKEYFKTTKNRFVKTGRTIVLANENTASASECLIGVLLTYGVTDRANDLVVANATAVLPAGNATYGKGIMQTTFQSAWGSALKMTTARIYFPDETTCIHGVGIVAEPENSVVYGNALSRAVALING